MEREKRRGGSPVTTEYELQRRMRIARNNEMLSKLNLPQLAANLTSNSKRMKNTVPNMPNQPVDPEANLIRNSKRARHAEPNMPNQSVDPAANMMRKSRRMRNVVPDILSQSVDSQYQDLYLNEENVQNQSYEENEINQSSEENDMDQSIEDYAQPFDKSNCFCLIY